MATIDRTVPHEQVATATSEYEVLVIGAGFAGIAAAIKLKELGIEDHLVVDEADDVGGTWHWNRYPGVAVDIPSFSYQYSFAPRADWSRVYAPGEELRRYARDLVEQYGLRERMRLRTRITGASFDEAVDRWTLTTDAGDVLVARQLIMATGALNDPRAVDIPGVADFAGETVHTARWDESVQLQGRRVGVIGTGASAVQLIAKVAPEVGHLTVFQRTPIWCLPKPDGPIPAGVQRAMQRVPGAQKALRTLSQSLVELQFPLALGYPHLVPTGKVGERLGRRMLRTQVADPATRAKLTPAYSLGCKRPAFHSSYLSTYNRRNVTLETTSIARVTETGVEMTDGTHHELDVLVLATGFRVFERGSTPPFPVAGVGGEDLEGFWDEHRYQAYHGISVPGFPNLHLVFGPYGYNVSSYLTHIENQLRHIGRLLEVTRQRAATRVEVTRAANERYFRLMLSQRPRLLLTRGTCAPANSYYFDRNGDSPFRAIPTLAVRWGSTRFPLADYAFTAVRDRVGR